MGFSVSGSAAIIFIGLFLAFSAWYTASVNSFEQINDAQQAQANGNVDQQNVDIELRSAVFDDGTDELTIEATNNGSIALWLGETDLLINNTYESGWESSASIFTGTSTVFGTSLWQPGEELTITVNWDPALRGGDPQHVKLVAEFGVAETTGVTTA
jgi:flagellar protein FlaF